MGVLASEKAITPSVIYKMWGISVLLAWDLWEAPVKQLRKLDNEPDTYQYFEEIAVAMGKIATERRTKRSGWKFWPT